METIKNLQEPTNELNELYRFTDDKDASDTPELWLDRLYIGRSNDGQMLDIYDRSTRQFIGNYCVDRFERAGVEPANYEASTVKNSAIFIFTIIDNGVKVTIADYDIRKLAEHAETAIFSHLTDHGHSDDEDTELATEDGYAEIVRVIPGDPESSEDVWSYCFDGDMKLRIAMDIFSERIEQDLISENSKVVQG